jgi:hypothetical protein
MHAFSHRRALCVVAVCACLIALVPAHAGAGPRARSTYPQRSTVPRRTAAVPKLSYYGGHVLSHVKVEAVVWSSWSYPKSVALTGPKSIASFFAGVTKSKYLDWLTEYNTPTQRIGRGSLEGVYTVHPPSADNGTTVTSAQIADGLQSMFRSGALPKPTTTRLYALFFRRGQRISTSFGNSTDDFCAYHDAIPYGSGAAYFAVVPYEIGNRGCRPASTSFDNVTTIVSHELVESITDPGVGLNRLAWYDQATVRSATSAPGSRRRPRLPAATACVTSCSGSGATDRARAS